jgi:putative Mg2+ transporter-C (MgtC) family protein
MDGGYTVNMNWGELSVLALIGRLGLATFLGLMIGIERERLERAAGMRTHALVSVASALIMIVSTYGFPAPEPGTSGSLDPSRIAAQVVSGVGFLGAGVIFMRRNTVRGLTTAASIWAVCGIGLAAGGGLLIPAIMGAAFMLLIQGGMRPLERRFFRHHATQHRVLVTASRAAPMLETIQGILRGSPVRLRSVEFDQRDGTGTTNIQLSFRAENRDDVLSIVDKLQANPEVVRVRWKQGSTLMAREGRVGIRDEPDDADEEYDG